MGVELLAYLRSLKTVFCFCFFLQGFLHLLSNPNKVIALAKADQCLPLCSFGTFPGSVHFPPVISKRMTQSSSGGLSSSSALIYDFCDVDKRKLTNFKIHKLNTQEIRIISRRHAGPQMTVSICWWLALASCSPVLPHIPWANLSAGTRQPSFFLCSPVRFIFPHVLKVSLNNIIDKTNIYDHPCISELVPAFLDLLICLTTLPVNSSFNVRLLGGRKYKLNFGFGFHHWTSLNKNPKFYVLRESTIRISFWRTYPSSIWNKCM